MSEIDSTFAVARVRELFNYDPETGVLTRRIQAANRTKAGDVAGTPSGNGYLKVTVDSKKCYVHRVIWLHVTGAWPSGNIDHINSDRSDNRFANLRDAPQAINNQNRRAANSRSSTGILGIGTCRGKFPARINFKGYRINLGTFDTSEEAHAAYLEAKRKLHEGNTL